MNRTVTTITGLFADNTPHNTGPDFGKASPIGLLIVVLLLIGTILLVRSMNRHLRKVPKSFDPDDPRAGQAAGGDVDTGEPGQPDNADKKGTSNEPDG